MVNAPTGAAGTRRYSGGPPNPATPAADAACCKTHTDSPATRRLILSTWRRMRTPLIATHLKPDGDALGSAIGAALYSRSMGNFPILFFREGEQIPQYFLRLIHRAGIPIVHQPDTSLFIRSLPRPRGARPFDGLIVVDCPKADLLETALRDSTLRARLYRQERIIEFDHHLGEVPIAPPPLSLVSDGVSSASELLASLLLPDARFSRHMARALLGGLLYDTSNLRFMVKADTRTIAERLLTRGSLPPGLHFRHIYELTCGLTSADIKLKDDCLGRAQSKTVTVAGRPYNLKWVVVKREELTPAHVNWRDALVTDLGFGTNGESGGCDIVLTVFWNGVKYRGSLRAYNQGSQLNFIPVAEAVSGGRGHPGAVGFDFNLAAFPNDQVAIESIIEALQTHGILQN